MLHSLLELALVNAAVLPLVDALAISFPECVVARVYVAIGEDVGSFAVFEAIDPAALVPVAILPLVHAVPVGFAVLPLSQVGVAKDASPHAVAFFDALAPLAIVDFAVGPVIDALAVSLAPNEIAFVLVAIGIPFHAFALSIVFEPLPLIHSIFPINHDSKSMAFSFFELSPEYCVLVLFYSKIIKGLYLLVVEHVGFHGILVSYLVHIPFLLLRRILLRPGLSLLLLPDQCFDCFLVEVGRVTKTAANLLNLPVVAIRLNLVLLLVRSIEFFEFFLLLQLGQQWVIGSNKSCTVLAGGRTVHVHVLPNGLLIGHASLAIGRAEQSAVH